MRKIIIISGSVLVLANIFCTSSNCTAYDENSPEALKVIWVDSSVPVFSTKPVDAGSFESVLSVPRGTMLPMKFVITTDKNTSADVSLRMTGSNDNKTRFENAYNVYNILPVHVEANTSNNTEVGAPVIATMEPYIIAKAPFDIAEVLARDKSIKLKADFNNVVLVDIKIPRDCKPGVYSGDVVVKSKERVVSNKISFKVFDTVLPDDYSIESSHWLSLEPQDLKRTDLPTPWSPEHWNLIKKSAQTLHEFGDNVVTIDTIYGDAPMVKTIKTGQGQYEFNFSKFDKMVKLFLDAGYQRIETVALSGHWIDPGGNIYCWDSKTGEKEMLFSSGYTMKNLPAYEKKYKWPEYRDRFMLDYDYRAKADNFLSFIEIYFKQFYLHIEEKGWKDICSQQLLDEPRTVFDYAIFSTMARRTLPGVKISNAIHAYGVDDYEAFSDYLDMWVMEMGLITQPKSQEIIKQRKLVNKRTGIYILARPSKWPNRLLDRQLLDNRIQLWQIYMLNADYYIHWAANRYRGTDPYKHSIGPMGKLPRGVTSAKRGHPPGCNWIFYPGPEGLLPSMRAIIFREGLIDYTLLKMLSERKPERVKQILNSLVTSVESYSRDPAAYHEARTEILGLLEE